MILEVFMVVKAVIMVLWIMIPCNLQVDSSNDSENFPQTPAILTDVSVVFLSPSRQMPR
jgi:hypothetical protein